MTAEQVEMSEELRPRSWPMVGVHAGLLVVIFGALYTVQVQGAVTRSEYAGYAVIGLALLLIGTIRVLDITSAASRGLLALGGAVALYLANEPYLAGLPGGGMMLESPAVMLQPSIAHVGVAIAGLFLGLQAAVDRRALPRVVEFRTAVVAAILLLAALSLTTWAVMRGFYDLSMTSGPSLLIFRSVAYGLLMIVCLTIPGVRSVGRAPHIYLGLALIGAVVRNLVVN